MQETITPDPAAEQKSAAEAAAAATTTTRKPRSDKQIAASLANGKKSTGPKTEEGRLKCSTAAKSQFQHHQLAETVLLIGESRRIFTDLLQRYIDTFQPMTEPEHNVIQKMVVAYWQHLRSWTLHQTAFNCEIARQPAEHPHNIKASAADRALTQSPNAGRNQSNYDRQFRNGMRDLILLRKLRGVTTGLDEVPTPVASSVYDPEPSSPESPTL